MAKQTKRATEKSVETPPEKKDGKSKPGAGDKAAPKKPAPGKTTKKK